MSNDSIATEQEGAVKPGHLRRIFNAVNLFGLFMEDGKDLTEAINAAASVFDMNYLELAAMVLGLNTPMEVSIFNVMERMFEHAGGE